MSKPIAIIAGVGNSSGTGAACAREFGEYRVAVLGRRAESLSKLVEELEAQGGEALAVPLREYARGPLDAAFRRILEHWPDSHLRLAIWNTSQWSSIPFLDTTEADIQRSMQINVCVGGVYTQARSLECHTHSIAAFAFAQQAIRAMLPHGQGGTLLVTGATSATRGAKNFAAFAAGKHGARAMTQSVAREFGPRGIHACFVIVDGTIATDATRRIFSSRPDRDQGWLDDRSQSMSPASIARAYRWLSEQSVDAWTSELDLRPAKEHF